MSIEPGRWTTSRPWATSRASPTWPPARCHLSAADATAHVLENPFAPGFLEGQAVLVTLVLVALLGAVFLSGPGGASATPASCSPPPP